MGILAALDRQIQENAHAPGPLDDFWYQPADSGVISDSGITMTPQAAMRISTFWKCVRWRSQQFGMLPKKIKENTTTLGRPSHEDARSHPLYSIVHTAPNPMMTSMAFFEHVSSDLDTDGNFYAWIQRAPNSARVQALWRLRPDRARIETEVMDSSGAGAKRWRIWYFFADDTGREERFFPDEILHIRGLGYDGIRGYSPVRMQMNALGWNAGAVRYGAQFFKQASRPSGLVISPHVIKDKDVRDRIVSNLSKSGKKAGSIALIEGGLEYKQLAMKQDEAQFIQTVEHQEEDIAGIMNVKPHKIGIMRHMTNNNVEQQNIEAVTDSLQPLCVRVEQWMGLQLLSGMPSTGRGGATERERFFFHCELKGLLRGDTAAQTAHLEKLLDRGVYSQNDARDFLGLSPYDGGDRRWINMAFQPLDRVDDMLDARAAPTPEQVSPNANEEAAVQPAVIAKPEAPAQPAEDALDARIQAGYGQVYRDAVGRVLARRKADRERVTPGLFDRILQGLCNLLGRELSEDFIKGYLGAMAKRSTGWSDAESVAQAELERAVSVIRQKGVEVTEDA